MPEGDTIFRAARSLRQWIGGREITGARSQRARVPPERLVGQTIEAVEARAKHLLIRLSSGEVLHTHMRMTGSWHVYSAGERWRKPGWQARLVLETGDRVAVCFEAPVVELLAPGEENRHPSLSRLGPDVLVDPLDLDEVRRRASTRSLDTPIGVLLLDQQVVSGIGNIYRCESLFVRRLYPWVPRSDLSDEDMDELVRAAARLMRANLEPSQGFGRDFGGGAGRPRVYGRHRRPCPRCRAPIEAAMIGDEARQVWWCPVCQPAAPHGSRAPARAGELPPAP
ncbi:MAG TPA: DNA-formamidopyrimidine glycosylase family protein [Acidimicrobiales bacterium]|nr:DNA-formamidopyrimidine glycosylase family protein [Acidimicrobiales bacterium]